MKPHRRCQLRCLRQPLLARHHKLPTARTAPGSPTRLVSKPMFHSRVAGLMRPHCLKQGLDSRLGTRSGWLGKTPLSCSWHNGIVRSCDSRARRRRPGLQKTPSPLVASCLQSITHRVKNARGVMARDRQIRGERHGAISVRVAYPVLLLLERVARMALAWNHSNVRTICLPQQALEAVSRNHLQ